MIDDETILARGDAVDQKAAERVGDPDAVGAFNLDERGGERFLVQGYQPQLAPWLGVDFHVVAPYFLMIAGLMVRPYGLFGTREVERV